MLFYDEEIMGQIQEKDLICFKQLLFGFLIMMIDGYNLSMLNRSGFGFYMLLMPWWITNWWRQFDVLTDIWDDMIIYDSEQLA